MDLHPKRLEACHPLVTAKGMEFLHHANAVGHKLLVVRSWSDFEEQMEIYKVGRTYNAATKEWEETGAVRTKAKPGTSAHNIITGDKAPASLAFDVIPIDSNGVPLWQVVDETPPQNELRWLRLYGRGQKAVWEELYKTAARCGLDAYGDTWGAYLAWDKGHFEEPRWQLALEPLGLTQGL